jgi:hypothetical protein
MMRRLALVSAFTLALLTRGPLAATPTPVVVELFTSEGCSDCPPADVLLQKLIDTQPIGGAEIIGLSEHVDYWDRLGWKDRFSSAALTDRQRTYSARFSNDSIYTPQMVVNGRAEFVGSDAAAARRAIEKSLSVPHGTIHADVNASSADRIVVSVSVSDLPPVTHGDHADVVLAVTEDRLQSDVKRGENKGHVLTHAAVVRYLATIGESGAALPSADVPLSPEWQREHLKLVAFVQERHSRAILASVAVPVKKNAHP